MKIGILIPSTSKGRNWVSYKESYLYNITLKTFLLTYDKEHTYEFYIGIDRYDLILDNDNTKNEIKRLKTVFKNINFDFIYMDGIVKGHLTVMWNRLFKKAIDDNCDYFYQCGDDIEFKTKGWVNECIKKLQENKNIGLTGPINNNPRILTQTFVSRIHYDLFGYYFPEEIINWCCDDWINDVYKNINAFFPLLNHLCVNIGGDPRYFINNDTTYNLNMRNNTILLREQCSKLVERDVLRIYIKCMNPSYTILNSAIPVLKKDYGSINNKINIFCQFFIHPIKERYNEIIFCLLKNVQNPHIDKIYLLNERIYNDNDLGGIVSDKIIQVNINKRLTYKDVFNYIEKNNINGFFCIINSDIFFDETLKYLHLINLSQEKIMFAQLRFEFDNKTKNTYINKPSNCSQDTWIFHTNFIKDILNNIELFNIQLGKPGCDNKILYLLNNIGFKIINDPYFIKTYHYHTSEIRNYNEIDRILGPYVFVNPIGVTIFQ